MRKALDPYHILKSYPYFFQNLTEEESQIFEFIIMNEKISAEKYGTLIKPFKKSVGPYDLEAQTGYSDGLQNAYFNIENFVIGDENYRVLSIEFLGDHKDEPYCFGPPRFRPRDFIGNNSFYERLERSLFCWRWVDKDDSSFRAVTIEDVPDTVSGLNYPIRSLIKPQDLIGTPEFYEQINENDIFNYRQIYRSRYEDSYRVVTIENE
ncbi:unnamed protein product [Blepharisma stoltei]|uniref:Uncharacterized protein n=1 Tax=Blepharisma stoltei TaxID=1481888 RepID=A0AAU9KCF2_9CILI|nr:unnamed protein product [Blepharisma stoltei]